MVFPFEGCSQKVTHCLNVFSDVTFYSCVLQYYRVSKSLPALACLVALMIWHSCYRAQTFEVSAVRNYISPRINFCLSTNFWSYHYYYFHSCSQCCSGASQQSHCQNIVTRLRKKELGDWRENGSEDRDTAQTQLPSHEVPSQLDEYEREELWLTKQRKYMAILRNDHTHRSSNSFNECLAIPFSILALHFR